MTAATAARRVRGTLLWGAACAFAALFVVAPAGRAGGSAVSNNTPPVISGTAQDGQFLTVTSKGTWTTPDALTFSYQWQRCDSGGANCTNVGSNASFYKQTSADIGHKLDVVVTATDQEAQSGQATSNLLGLVSNPPAPQNTVAPVIAGTAQDGQTLTVSSNGKWTSADTLTFSYQWQRCDSGGANCANIGGATAASYKLTSADVAHKLQVVVTDTDQESQSAHATSNQLGPGTNPAAPLNTIAPVIGGTAQDGQFVKVTSNGKWTTPDTLSFGYQWQRCDSGGANCANIAGATVSFYKLAAADVGHKVQVVVTDTDAESQSGHANSNQLGPGTNPAAPLNTVAPVIAGTAQDGQTLRVTSNGKWTSADVLTFTYQWQRCDSGGASCANIGGATAATYKLASADVGHKIQAVVTDTDAEDQSGHASSNQLGPGTNPAAPLNTIAPVIGGTAQDGQFVAITSNGKWTTPDPLSLGYQWQRCASDGTGCVNIASATVSFYKLTSADIGHKVQVVVTDTDAESQSGHANSNQLGAVIDPPAPLNTLAPAISGTAQNGQILKVTSNGKWTSADMLAYSYQWQRCDSGGAGCTNIVGATGGTYKLASADVDHKVQAVVTATDQESQSTGASSNQLGPVPSDPAPQNTVAPAISGTAQDGQVVSVTSNGTWSSATDLTYTFQWQRCASDGTGCVNIAGATNSSYTLAAADVTHKIQAVVTATDQESQSTPATSNQLGAVANPPLPHNTVAPTITGTGQDGQTITIVSNGTWTSPDNLVFTYVWQRCIFNSFTCTQVSTASSYHVTSIDVGMSILVKVIATDSEGQFAQAFKSYAPIAGPAPPQNTVPPTISGTAQVGHVLTVSGNTWSSPDTLTYGYQWQRCASDGTSCVDISAATNNTYTLVAADVGHKIQLVVTATDQESQSTEATSNQLGAVTS